MIFAQSCKLYLFKSLDNKVEKNVYDFNNVKDKSIYMNFDTIIEK